MSKSKPNIAVLTANYNNDKYIPNYLSGILSQTRLPDTVVFVDDASTDNSWQVIVSEVSKHLNNVEIDSTKNEIFIEKNGTKFILARKEKNSGPAATRNVGLKYLINQSDAICICDSDDVYYPTKIEKSLNILENFSHVGLVYSDYDVFNVSTQKKSREFKEPFNYKRLVEECIVSNNSILVTNILNKIGLYDESLRGPEDYDLWLRISEVAAVHHIPEALYQYTITGNNITVTTPKNTFAEHVARVHRKVQERRNAK